jgi:hypothetical protein
MKHLHGTDYATLSLVSITLTSIITDIHHIYRLGFAVLLPAALIVVLPYVLMRWYKHTGKKAALWAYGSLTSVIVVWFGVIDGFLDHVMKALGLQNTTFLPGGEAEVVKTVFSLWSPEAGNIFYEGSGIFTFIASVFAIYYTFRFIQAQRSSRSMGTSRTSRLTRSI